MWDQAHKVFREGSIHVHNQPYAIRENPLKYRFVAILSGLFDDPFLLDWERGLVRVKDDHDPSLIRGIHTDIKKSVE